MEVIPGVVGALACAAKVSAPVSFGDEDTPLKVVKKKLSGIAQSGLAI